MARIAARKFKQRRPGRPSKDYSALWERLQKLGDPRAKDEILAIYSYLPRFIIGRMKLSLVPTLDVDDLESVGTIGLIKAIEKFDPERNVKFETYAYRWVQGSVLDYIRQLDYLSRTSRERVNRLKNAFLTLKGKLNRNPTDMEIRKELKISDQELNKTYFEMSHSVTVSLESEYPYDSSQDGSERNERVVMDKKDEGPLANLEKKEIVRHLAQAIDQLNEKEKLIISLYYYEDLTFKEIGSIIGTSESRVCQLHSKSILSLNAALSRSR